METNENVTRVVERALEDREFAEQLRYAAERAVGKSPNSEENLEFLGLFARDEAELTAFAAETVAPLGNTWWKRIVVRLLDEVERLQQGGEGPSFRAGAIKGGAKKGGAKKGAAKKGGAKKGGAKKGGAKKGGTKKSSRR